MFSPDLPDQLPSLTPAPPKKSRFKAGRVTFEDEDAGERLDRHDVHVSAILSRIVVSTRCFVQILQTLCILVCECTVSASTRI